MAGRRTNTTEPKTRRQEATGPDDRRIRDDIQGIIFEARQVFMLVKLMAARQMMVSNFGFHKMVAFQLNSAPQCGKFSSYLSFPPETLKLGR